MVADKLFVIFVYAIKGNVRNVILLETSLKAPLCPVEKKNSNFLALNTPPATPECPQKNSAQSVQPFGRLSVTYTNVLFYYIDK